MRTAGLSNDCSFASRQHRAAPTVINLPLGLHTVAVPYSPHDQRFRCRNVETLPHKVMNPVQKQQLQKKGGKTQDL